MKVFLVIDRPNNWDNGKKLHPSRCVEYVTASEDVANSRRDDLIGKKLEIQSEDRMVHRNGDPVDVCVLEAEVRDMDSVVGHGISPEELIKRMTDSASSIPPLIEGLRVRSADQVRDGYAVLIDGHPIGVVSDRVWAYSFEHFISLMIYEARKVLEAHGPGPYARSLATSYVGACHFGELVKRLEEAADGGLKKLLERDVVGPAEVLAMNKLTSEVAELRHFIQAAIDIMKKEEGK